MDVPIPLQTQRLILRRLCASDWPHIFEYARLPEVHRHTKWNGPSSIEEVMEALGPRCDANYAAGIWDPLAITLKDHGFAIGTAGIAPHKDTGRRHGELSYALAPSYWGQGIAYEAASALLTEWFGAGGGSMFITTRSANRASSSLASRLLFAPATYEVDECCPDVPAGWRRYVKSPPG